MGRGALRENCYDFNETVAAQKLLSLLHRSSSFVLESRRLSVERKYFLSILSVKCSGQISFLWIR